MFGPNVTGTYDTRCPCQSKQNLHPDPSPWRRGDAIGCHIHVKTQKRLLIRSTLRKDNPSISHPAVRDRLDRLLRRCLSSVEADEIYNLCNTAPPVKTRANCFSFLTIMIFVCSAHVGECELSILNRKCAPGGELSTGYSVRVIWEQQAGKRSCDTA